MKKLHLTLFALILSTVCIAEETENLFHYGFDLKSGFVLDDSTELTPGAVFQPWVSISATEHCSVELWASKGLESDENDEFDIGGLCQFGFESGLTITAHVIQYVTRGYPDIVDGTVNLAYGKFDFEVSHYAWLDGFEDGMHISIGYKHQLAERLASEVRVLYHTGLEAGDIVVPSLQLDYELSDTWSINAKGLFPLEDDSYRPSRLIVGIAKVF